MPESNVTLEEYTKHLSILPQTDLGIVHHFSDGLYAKQMRLPKGHIAVSHKHHYSHLSILSMGKACVKTDETNQIFFAPACIEIKSGIQHSIEALEDIVWFCIHATDAADPNMIDQVLIKEK